MRFIRGFSLIFTLAICYLCCSLLAADLSANQIEEVSNQCCPHSFVNQLYVGPEIYHVRRVREGGTKQSGWIFGFRAGYEHIKRFKFYWGGDVLYGKGTLEGHSTGSKLRSRFIDKNIEGRFGYTFQQKVGYRLALTPFIGAGYGEECNNFVSPSPLKVHFKLRFNYAVAGFLSKMNLSPCLSLGFNFKARFLYDAKNHVAHDPEIDNFKMLVKNQMHYRLELPISYQRTEHFLLNLVPFYEFRHYGGQVNFPFDFLESKLNIYGATLKFLYSF